jgi:hypothetical protein
VSAPELKVEIIATTHGNVGAMVRNEAGAGPLWLLIAGLGTPPSVLSLFPEDAPLAQFGLPAFGGPTLADYSAEAISDAFDQALAARFPDREILILGLSFGAVLALGMKSPQVTRLVAVEPFLSSDRPALADMIRNGMLPKRADLQAFFADAFGYDASGVTPRTYGIATPAAVYVVAGDGTAIPGDASLPSLCTPEDRTALEARGAVVTLATGRHDIATTDPAAIGRAMRTAS